MINDCKLSKTFVSMNTITRAIEIYKQLAEIKIVNEDDKYYYMTFKNESENLQIILKEFNNYCIGTEGWGNVS